MWICFSPILDAPFVQTFMEHYSCVCISVQSHWQRLSLQTLFWTLLATCVIHQIIQIYVYYVWSDKCVNTNKKPFAHIALSPIQYQHLLWHKFMILKLNTESLVDEWMRVSAFWWSKIRLTFIPLTCPNLNVIPLHQLNSPEKNKWPFLAPICNQ